MVCRIGGGVLRGGFGLSVGPVRRFQVDTAGAKLKEATKDSESLGRQYQVGTRSLRYKRRTVLILGFVDLRNRWLFATAVNPKMKTLQVQRGLTGLLNLGLFILWYKGIWGRDFAIPPRRLGRLRAQAQCIDSRQGAHDPGSKGLRYR